MRLRGALEPTVAQRARARPAPETLSSGGYVIVDDCKLPRFRAAVDDLRTERGITEELRRIDCTGVY